jgi:hypothetical protein
MNTAKALVPSLPDLRLKDLIDRFDLLLRSKCEIESRGVPTQFLSDFFTAPGNVQKNVVDQISDYLAILEDASRQGITLLNDKRLAWFAVGKLQLVPPSGFLDTIEPDDYLEIYNASGIQIFRNLEFYRIVSYSVAEITFYPWDRLYRRDEHILQQIMEQGFVKGFSGVKEPYPLTIDEHIVSEAISSEGRSYHIKFGMLSPLIGRSKKTEAVFATSKLKRIK